jgi:hypothetical protein
MLYTCNEGLPSLSSHALVRMCRFIKPSVEQHAVDASYDTDVGVASGGSGGSGGREELASVECCVCMVRGE